jgi:hypothetical protein
MCRQILATVAQNSVEETLFPTALLVWGDYKIGAYMREARREGTLNTGRGIAVRSILLGETQFC